MIAPMRTLLSGRPLILLGIVIGNLIPVGGVLFLGWDAVQILILYWVENLVIGALTLPRILAARGSCADASAADRARRTAAANRGMCMSRPRFRWGVPESGRRQASGVGVGFASRPTSFSMRRSGRSHIIATAA